MESMLNVNERSDSMVNCNHRPLIADDRMIFVHRVYQKSVHWVNSVEIVEMMADRILATKQNSLTHLHLSNVSDTNIPWKMSSKELLRRPLVNDDTTSNHVNTVQDCSNDVMAHRSSLWTIFVRHLLWYQVALACWKR
jgi:hypothetical protein